MLNQEERKCVEMIRGASDVTIIINDYGRDNLTLKFMNKEEVKKLAHDIALSVQDIYNKRR